MIRRLLLIFLLQIACRDGTAQPLPNVSLSQIGQEEGLQSGVVYYSIEDKQGLVWLCTYDGLYVYDGYRARKIPIRTCNTCPPVNMGVHAFLPISNTECWILSSFGMGKLNPVSGLFNIIIPSVKTENYLSIHQITDSLLTIAGIWKKPYIINRYTHQFELFSEKKEIQPFGYYAKEVYLKAMEGFPGYFFLSPFNTTYQNLPGTLKFKPIKTPAGYEHKNNDIDSIPIPGNRVLIYGPGASFGRPDIEVDFDIQNAKDHSSLKGSITSNQNYVLRFQPVVDRFENVWLVTDSGFFCLPAGENRLIDLADKYPVFNNLSISGYHQISEKIWLYTRGNGIFIIKPQFSVFKTLHENSQPAALAKDFVLHLYPAANNRLIIKHDFAYSSAATLLDLHAMQSTIIKGSSLIPIEKFTFKNEALPLSTGFFTSIDSFKKVMKNDYKPSSGQRYFGSGVPGLFYILDPSGILRQMPSGKAITGPIIDITTKFQGDTLWIGTESVGLIALHLPTGKVRQYQPQSNPKEGPAHNRVHGICFDATGNLWIATSGGLSYFNKKQQYFTHYTEGICHPVIYNITMDRQGMLWLGTGNGLSRFDTTAKTFTNFFATNGLINTEYDRNSAYLADDGRIFMGGTRGIDYFDPAEVKINTIEFTPLITLVSLPNKSLNPMEACQLAPTENNLFFSFSASPVSEAKNCTYLYRLLKGSSGKWEKLINIHELQFANLSPGEYTLQLKTVNQNGEQSKATASFSFIIQTPWHQTPLFLLAALIFCLVIFYFLVSYSQKQKLKKLAHENELIKLKADQVKMLMSERERITADLHDDVGATLSSLNIYGDLAHSIWDENPEKSKEMVGKIAGQSRELLQRMSDIIWSMKTEGNDSYGLTPRIRNFAQELLAGKGIEVKIDIDEAKTGAVTNPLVRKNIILIIKEALNNMAKYSGASKADISIREHENAFILEIRDNGKGFDKEAATRGNGLDNMDARCRQMGGTFALTAKPGEGTTITCRIPLAIISYSGNE